MGWLVSEDPEEFDVAAGAFLRRRPVEHTILLTVLEGLRGGVSRGGAGPRFGWWRRSDGAVAGAFLHTVPHPVATTAMPDDAVADLVELLAGEARPVPEVSIDRDLAGRFARRWCARTGRAPATSLRLRLHRLTESRPPRPAPPGRVRVAGPADRDLLVAWLRGFARDIGQPEKTATSSLDERLAGGGGFFLWEDGRRAVSLAGVKGPAAGVARVGPVYTPPEDRCRGYAAAATVAASRAALDAGAAAVVLFTDLDNPTSNALYHRLGFRPVGDRLVLALGG